MRFGNHAFSVLLMLLSTGCVVPSPHGGLALWVPGSGIVAGPGVRSSIGYHGPRYLGEGDGKTFKSAFVLRNFQSKEEAADFERIYVLGMRSTERGEPESSETIVEGRTYHVWRWTREAGGTEEWYFDATNPLQKKKN